nr:hypothetical protein [Gammaproteobacteria bacterium]
MDSPQRFWDVGAVTALLVALAQGKLRLQTAKDAYSTVAAIDKRRRPDAPPD